MTARTSRGVRTCAARGPTGSWAVTGLIATRGEVSTGRLSATLWRDQARSGLRTLAVFRGPPRLRTPRVVGRESSGDVASVGVAKEDSNDRDTCSIQGRHGSGDARRPGLARPDHVQRGV